MEYVLSSGRREASDETKASVGQLRSAYNEVLRLESRRRRRVERLRERARRDDIKGDVLNEAARLGRSYPATAIVPAHFEDFFEKRLDGLYEAELAAVDEEAQEQEEVLAQVERANGEFEARRHKVGDRGLQEREQALQRLDGAYCRAWRCRRVRGRRRRGSPRRRPRQRYSRGRATRCSSRSR